MEIFCPTCGKCYRVPDKKLSDQVKKVRCKACRNVFTLQPNDSEKQSGKDGNPLFALREMESSAQENSGTPDVLKPEKSEAEVESPHAGGNPASVDRDFLLESDKGEGSRDYLAIAVILAAIVTLGIVSFLGIRKMDRDSFFQPLRSISRLT